MTAIAEHANGSAHPHPPVLHPLVPAGPVQPWPRAVAAPALADTQTPPAEPAASPPSQRRQPRRWPLLVIGSAAAVAIWSGWVALGAMCGFGPVQPLPGIAPWRIDTAITLPVSMEAYGAYALGIWLSLSTPERARKFAARSAIGSLMLGMSGQVIYHLLAAAHASRAPWPVVVLVSCIPVAALALAATLAHLLRDAKPDDAGDENGRQDVPAKMPPAAEEVTPPEPAITPGPEQVPVPAEPPRDAELPAAKPPRDVRRQTRHPRSAPARKPEPGPSKLAAAKALLHAAPAMTVSDLMQAGVSEGTARRAKKEQAEA